MSNRAKNVMVSFSKRRNGLFRKASELCSKCDAQVAVLVVSSAGNPFAFGHPSVDELLGAGVEIGDAIDGERQRSKAREVEWLKARVKMRKKEEAFEAWVERKIEACETVEELEALKLECLALRDKIARKLCDNDESFLGDDDVVLDFSCLFEDHARGYNGCDDVDGNLLPLAQSDAPFSAEKNDGSFSMGKYVDVAMDQENDASFTGEIGESTGGSGLEGTTTEYYDHVFDCLGQISCGFDQDFWD